MTIETGSQKTQYKKISEIKSRQMNGEEVYLQIGQYNDFNTGTLSRLLHKEGTDTFLHGQDVDNRFLRAHYAKKQGVIIPSEPQQSKMVLKDHVSRHLEAISRILGSEVSDRRAKEEKVA